MTNKFTIFNTMSRQKEVFEPLNPPFVGLYVCGPTVYGDAHLGHARAAITFDTLFRYLTHCGYKVRYVRNITDVGHMTGDTDEGEDKIGKKAVLEKLEPMEVVQKYTNRYHRNMRDLNTLPPSIEPSASGHIIEQQEMVTEILRNGYAYEVNGSIYFDVNAYNRRYEYGKLSGRKIEELIANTRQLEGQEEKRNPYDFALWKKANPEHIMKWKSPWGEGFPGWHLECSCMSQKYLGSTFDIHGGGLDLQFPHHECEIAQSTASLGHESVKYWMHNNMVTVKGQKMGKSIGNFITLDELFSGQNSVLEQAYSPMTVRFFILQAHYRSPLDFSNEALKSAEKGYERLMQAMETLNEIKPQAEGNANFHPLIDSCFEALNDDLNTPVLIARLFDAVRIINNLKTGSESVNREELEYARKEFNGIVYDILGLKNEMKTETGGEKFKELVEAMMEIRQNAKKNKEWSISDKIREGFEKAGISIKDTKEGYEWEIK